MQEVSPLRGDLEGSGRRAALTSIALLAGTALAKAQSKVEPKTTDGGLADIVKKIEKDLDYPGQVRATIIREVRVVDYAK